MVFGKNPRAVQRTLFTPFATLLLRLGFTPNAVTIVGTLLTTAVALVMFPLGYLVSGSLALGVLVLTDSIDGLMARQSGKASPFGAFLDSTLDRLSDAAIFVGVTLWFLLHTEGITQIVGMCAALGGLVFGSMVPYVRAKAESLGVDASVGVAERADRVLIILVATFITGLGLPIPLFIGILITLAVLSLVTVLQRIRATRLGLRAHED